MKTALVTGANRGIGLEFVRQLKKDNYYVIACSRLTANNDVVSQLADEVIALDVTDDNDIKQLVITLANRPIDLLINNAGVSGESGVTVGHVARANFLHVLNVNCVSVVKLTDALLPNINAGHEKTIVVISSQMGSIADNHTGRSYAYRASKAALNAAMRSVAIDVKSSGIYVMLIHPGWVKTDMGGRDALVDVATSVTGMLEQIQLHGSKSHATELRRFDGKIIAW